MLVDNLKFTALRILKFKMSRLYYSMEAAIGNLVAYISEYCDTGIYYLSTLYSIYGLVFLELLGITFWPLLRSSIWIFIEVIVLIEYIKATDELDCVQHKKDIISEE